ncbi:MAG: ATP-binding protein [Gammaproteobacteria bacterium]
MNPKDEGDSGRKMSVRRDILLIVVIAIIAAFLCAKYNLSEALLKWTRPLERLQLDEAPAVLLVIAVCLIWFSSRRYFEAKRQLRLRRSVEVRLAEALAENQRLAQQYVDMQEHERKALARDLHDELGQYLNAIKLDALSIREGACDLPVVDRASQAMITNIDRMYGVVTGLIRQLRPVGLDDLGVAAALEHCVNEWRLRLPHATIDVSISGDFENMTETAGLVIYRLVQEALTNIARHADATRVEIRVTSARSATSDESIEILIADNGRGTDMKVPRSGLGLVGMRERVSALGGSIVLASELGAGFKIVASVPTQ